MHMGFSVYNGFSFIGLVWVIGTRGEEFGVRAFSRKQRLAHIHS